MLSPRGVDESTGRDTGAGTGTVHDRAMSDDTSRRKLTLPRLAAKVAWEGGLVATLDYGVRSDDIDDPETAALWRELEHLYDEMTPLMAQLDLRIRRARAA